MSGTQFYTDTPPQPGSLADYGAVTLATTSKQLWTPGTETPLNPANLFIGKKMKMVAFGRFTSAATPGNLTVELRAAVADNAGVLLASSAALTWLASQTSKSWRVEMNLTIRALGTAAKIFAGGVFECSPAAIAAAQGLIPENTPAEVTGIDLTAAANQGLSLQMKRSGSTAETVQVHDVYLQHLN